MKRNKYKGKEISFILLLQCMDKGETIMSIAEEIKANAEYIQHLKRIIEKTKKENELLKQKIT